MSFFEELRNTKISDAAFYLIFILAEMAPGTSFAMYFFLDIFKSLDTWKALFMIIAISSPLTVVAILFAFIGNVKAPVDEKGLKTLTFFSCIASLTSSYLALLLGYMAHWEFDLTAMIALLGAMFSSYLFGLIIARDAKSANSANSANSAKGK